MLGNTNLCNNLSSSLCAVLFVYCVVTTSDEQIKSKIEVSAKWYIAVNHQRLSSIRIIFVNYQTSRLQCNYQFYIQVGSIRDAQSFSSIASIALSRGFSNETLIEVRQKNFAIEDQVGQEYPCHGRLDIHVRHSSHLKIKVHGVGLDMYRVQKLLQ